MARAMKHRSDAWDKEQSAFAKELGNIETMARMLGTPDAVKEGRVQAAWTLVVSRESRYIQQVSYCTSVLNPGYSSHAS